MSRKKRWLSIIILVLLIGTAIILYPVYFPGLPKSIKIYGMAHLDQNWSPEDRQWYYHTSQGTLIIPYDWYVNMDALGPPFSAHSQQRFAASENMSKYRLLPNPDTQGNPDRLPIGITGQAHPKTGQEFMSFTCAMCHTGQINYKGMGIRIEGGPAAMNFEKFTNDLVIGLALNLSPFRSGRLTRFAEGILGDDYSKEGEKQIKKDLEKFLEENIPLAIFEKTHKIYPTAGGFGRVDALGRGVNGMFQQLGRDNIRMSNAPVSNPPLWYTHYYDWVQTDASIRQPLGRNVTEAIGVNAFVDLTGNGGKNPEELFLSSVQLENMYQMETLLGVLEAPSWPEDILGPIDWEKAERGRVLYEEAVFENALSPQEALLFYPLDTDQELENKGYCARCHGPVWSRPNEYGKSFMILRMYKFDVLGTSDWDAKNFAARDVDLTAPEAQLFREKVAGGKEKLGIGEAIQLVTNGAMNRKFPELGWTPEELPEYQGYRANEFRAPLGYPARPMAGYWATSPYLHNNSVPNLYQLLSPVEERSKVFWTGDLEYDPVNVGYLYEKFKGGFEFDTSVDGNGNSGHEFRDAAKGTPGVIGPALTSEQRYEIIEYMKVIRDVVIPPETRAEREEVLKAIRSSYAWQKDYDLAGTKYQVKGAYGEVEAVEDYPSGGEDEGSEYEAVPEE